MLDLRFIYYTTIVCIYILTPESQPLSEFQEKPLFTAPSLLYQKLILQSLPQGIPMERVLYAKQSPIDSTAINRQKLLKNHCTGVRSHNFSAINSLLSQDI